MYGISEQIVNNIGDISPIHFLPPEKIKLTWLYVRFIQKLLYHPVKSNRI
jgi:hypothetical protein